MWTLGELVPVAFAVTARIQGRCDRERLRDALALVRLRHPMLAVRVTGRSLTARDTLEPPLRIAEGGWDEAVAEELNRPFGQDGPLTRFLLIDRGESFDLAVVCHHVVGDGLSLAHVLHDIVACLADPGAVRAEPVAAPPMRELMRALPEPPRSEPVTQPRPDWPVRPRTTGERFALVDHVLDPAEGAALLERCRAERTSVHAALGLAGLRALADLDGRTRRQFFYPVDLRPLLTGLAAGACGAYAIEVGTWFDSAAEPGFWPAARTLREAVRRQTAPDRLRRQVRLLQLTTVLPGGVLGRLLRISCKPYSSFTLSNLGRLPFPARHRDLRIDSMHLAVHMGTLSNGLLGAVTVGDRVSLTMSTTDSARPAAEQIVKSALGHLRAALDRAGPP